MKEFLEADPPPLLGDFKAEIIHYERLMEEINDLPECTEVGAVALFCGKSTDKRTEKKMKKRTAQEYIFK